MLDPKDILLTDQVAIVTGGGAGIGKGIALGMARFGARIGILERDADTAAEVAAVIEAAGGQALSLPTDVRDPAAVEEAVAAVHGRWGQLDILVNNAGGVFAAPFLETSPNGWEALWRANFGHVLHCTKAVGDRMVARGSGGSIVNVVSIEGVRAAPMYAVYAAAKAATINFTRSMALELAPSDIRVNALAPDICVTEGLEAMMGAEGLAHARHTVPMARLGHPDDLAGAAIFLCSKLGSYVTGQVLHVDGGTQASSGWYHDPDDGHYVYGAPRPRSSS